MRERGQGVTRLVESHRSGIAIDAIGARPADISASLFQLIERPCQIFVLPWCELIAAQRGSASGLEQFTTIRLIVGREPAGCFTDGTVDDAGRSWKLGRYRLAIRTEQELHELRARVHVDHELGPDGSRTLDAVDLGERVVARVAHPDSDGDVRGESHCPDIPEVVGRA